MRTFEWLRFDGGYVNEASVGIGKESLHMIRDGQNIRTRSGDIQPRKGSVDYFDFTLTAPIAGNTVGSLHEYQRQYVDGVTSTFWRRIIFTMGSHLYYGDPGSPTVAVEIDPTLLLSISEIYGVNVYDHFIFGNGTDPLRMTDGNNVYLVGIVAPDVMTLNTNNNPGGESRKYKYTYFRDADPYDRESEASEVRLLDDVVDSANPDVDLDYTQATDSQVTHYKFYATAFWDDDTETEESDFFLIGTKTLAEGVADGHVFTDTQVDPTSLPAYDTTVRGVPPTMKFLLWHDNRIFGAGVLTDPSIIFYSVIGKPFYWSIKNNWDEVSRDDGSDITGLAAIGATRFIFKTNGIFEWTGDPESTTPIHAVERPDASMNMTRLAVGCSDSRSLCAWSNALIFRAADGHVFHLTMTDLTQLSRYIETDIQDLSSTDAAVHNDYYIISDGDTTLVCDLRRGVRGWEPPDVGIDPTSLLVDHNGFLLGAEGDKIVRYYTGTQDNGVDFQKKVRPAFVKFGRGKQTAAPRKIIVEAIDRTGSINVVPYNKDGAMSALDIATYTLTKRWVSIPRGGRGDYLSYLISWNDNTKIQKIANEYQLVKRH